MKILILGSTGFIGKAIVKKLRDKTDHEIISSNSQHINFATLIYSEELVEKLKGIDILINSVGIIAETAHKKFEQIHALAPIALFDACKNMGVRKIIQVSALGSQEGNTEYHTSKNRADKHLKSLEVNYAILHPSIVYGDDGKSTALFAGLATLPMTPIVGDGSQILQPIHIDDLTEAVIVAISSTNRKIELDLVGDTPISYRDLLAGFRRWLGHKPTKSIAMPTIGTNLLGKILDEPTVNSDNITMLNQGNSANVAPLAEFLGYLPKSINEKLFSKQAHHAQKLYASLYLLRPLLRLIIGFVWIWSGVVSAFLYPHADAVGLLHDIGIMAPLDTPLLYLASFIDIVLGVLIMMGYRLRLLLLLSIIIITAYTLVLTLLAPYHWLHPFGPLLKNLPLVVTLFILMKLEEYR